MKIAIASGKGGTGKTTVAVNLAVTAARLGFPVHLCDCDVEEPNAHLFLDPVIERTREVTTPVPRIDPDRCTHCGLCGRFCEFNAIAALPGQTFVFEDLCHGCGGCWRVCPHGAITPESRVVGEMATGSSCGPAFSRGRLRVGETLVPPLIRQVKQAPEGETWVIHDAPPGATCPVVTTLEGADYVVLVTEPTPFGLHDLRLALRLVDRMGIPAGVVVNRADVLHSEVEDHCREHGLPLLARIPFQREIAAACADGALAIDVHPEIAHAFVELFGALQWCEVVP